ncbi:MAG TPA: AprI/Inh family metalloprotease inhibitor [Xanthobacteraceae bacterium]|nr:AprI/Inh family metalloprotease inhibitor [Xanthobacteraceae bacterium]
MVRSAVVGVGIAMSLCCGALAQETSGLSDAAKTMTGAWELSNADRDKVCRITFRADAMAGGYRADLDRNCANLFPSTKDIAGWTIDNLGTLRLIDAQSNAVLELTEVESGIFDGFQPGEGRYVLQSAAAVPVRSAEDMVGVWAVARGAGKPICLLTLVGSPAAADTLALKIKPGCDALVAHFAPTAWRMEQGELVLLSGRGQSWRFEENDANTWQRVPQAADPVLLMRQ